jgi:hypothetical protein
MTGPPITSKIVSSRIFTLCRTVNLFPKRGTYLQGSRGSKKALHLVMCSRGSPCESSNYTLRTQYTGPGGKKWLKQQLQKASL